MEDVDDLVERIVAELGRTPSASEQSAIRAFAVQSAMLCEGRELAAQYGLTQFNEQTGTVSAHPAVGIVKAASSELRGWLTARPDLFVAAVSGGGETSLADELAALRAQRSAG